VGLSENGSVVSDQQMWADAIGRLARREHLSAELVETAMSAILDGRATDAQIAGFAVALRGKGETPTELAALVRAMMRFAERVELEGDAPTIDTCGTGGDRSGTINVSTMAALVAAGAGARVVKHGNRAASSQCGSADVLEALGVVIDLGPAGVARCVDEAGIGFCFAPRFHPAMRFAAPARKELGVATTFNFLGPLANPGRVRCQAVGVSDPAMAEPMAATLVELGAQHVLVFYGHDGLDELTTTTTSTVIEARNGSVRSFEIDPTEHGLPRVERGALAGGDAAGNAAVSRQVLAGKPGPFRDIVVLNAAAALLVAGMADDIGAGIDTAQQAIDDGRAEAALDAFVRVSVAAREAEAPE
jgi:anthranilate phosphoribosyltransferase